MKKFKFYIFAALLSTAFFLTGCYTQLAIHNSRSTEAYNNSNDYYYADEDTSYYDEDSTYNYDDEYYDYNQGSIVNNYYIGNPFYRRYFYDYYPSIAIGAFYGSYYYDPFYWDPFYYNYYPGWYNPFIMYSGYYSPYYGYYGYNNYYGGYYYGGYNSYGGFYNKPDRTRERLNLRNSNGLRGSVSVSGNTRTGSTGSSYTSREPLTGTRPAPVVNTGEAKVSRSAKPSTTERERLDAIKRDLRNNLYNTERKVVREKRGKTPTDPREILPPSHNGEAQRVNTAKNQRINNDNNVKGNTRTVRPQPANRNSREVRRSNNNERPHYTPPSRSSTPHRTYSTPRKSSPPSRSYNPPRRSYSPPSRSYNPPSRSSSPPPRSTPPSSSRGNSGRNSSGSRR